jgi:predicted nuclease of restriction endonuclease-like (RecB) superfamily
MRGKTLSIPSPRRIGGYETLLGDVTRLLEDARRTAARSVNTILTATYWEIGRRIVEYEQGGEKRAAYGTALLKQLSTDLTVRFGRGFSERNLEQMRVFYLGWPIPQTVSAESGKSTPRGGFPLPWSHYVRLLSVENLAARTFYETQALHGGWSVRQLDRQISTLFYERVALSRDKATMLKKGNRPKSGETLTPGEEIKDPFVLEFLGLKDEYSENNLEAALIDRLEHFLLELGNDFTFVARQKRLRVGDEWYRVDLMFFHRRLRCLIIIDLKLGKFTHADVGQMNLYLNYAKEHWTLPHENPPIGLILCAKGDEAVAHYALGGLSNQVFASRYKLQLPDPDVLRREIEAERRKLEQRGL